VLFFAAKAANSQP